MSFPKLLHNGSFCRVHDWQTLHFLFRPTLFNILPWVRLQCLQMFTCLVPCCWIWPRYSENRKSSDLLHKYNIPVHQNSSLNNPSSLLSCFLCLPHNRRGKKLLQALALREPLGFGSVTIPTLAFSHFVYNQTILFLLVLNAVNRYTFPSPHTCQKHRNFLKGKVLIELQDSQLSVLQEKEAYNDWFIMFDFRFGKF